MALDDLQSVIKKLQETIETHRDYLSENETRTRQLLIDPLLRQLGWDISDPGVVQLELKLEFKGTPGWVDYVLMNDARSVAAIEAKKLGSNLADKVIKDVTGYANLIKATYAIRTDGDKWVMCDVSEPTERPLMELDLSQQSDYENVLKALAMWRPILSTGSRPSEAARRVLGSSAPPNVPPNGESPIGEPRSALQGDNHVLIVEYKPSSEKYIHPEEGYNLKFTKPLVLTFMGKRREIGKWNELLNELRRIREIPVKTERDKSSNDTWKAALSFLADECGYACRETEHTVIDDRNKIQSVSVREHQA